MPRNDESTRSGALSMAKGVLVALALACAASTGADDPNRAVAFMRDVVGFSQAQVASVEAGEVVTKQLPATDKSELVAFGAVRVHGERAAFLRQFGANVGRSRRGAILEIGRLSRPPRVDDLAALTLDADALAAARECKPGDCSIKLSRSAMDRIQGTIDWKAADAPVRATQLVKEMLVDYTTAYMKGGTAAMATYADKAAAEQDYDAIRGRLIGRPSACSTRSKLSISTRMRDSRPDLNCAKCASRRLIGLLQSTAVSE